MSDFDDRDKTLTAFTGPAVDLDRFYRTCSRPWPLAMTSWPSLILAMTSWPSFWSRSQMNEQSEWEWLPLDYSALGASWSCLMFLWRRSCEQLSRLCMKANLSLSVCLLATARVCATKLCLLVLTYKQARTAVVLFSPTNGLGQLTVLLLRVFTVVSDAAT